MSNKQEFTPTYVRIKATDDQAEKIRELPGFIDLIVRSTVRTEGDPRTDYIASVENLKI